MSVPKTVEECTDCAIKFGEIIKQRYKQGKEDGEREMWEKMKEVCKNYCNRRCKLTLNDPAYCNGIVSCPCHFCDYKNCPIVKKLLKAVK